MRLVSSFTGGVASGAVGLNRTSTGDVVGRANLSNGEGTDHGSEIGYSVVWASVLYGYCHDSLSVRLDSSWECHGDVPLTVWCSVGPTVILGPSFVSGFTGTWLYSSTMTVSCATGNSAILEDCDSIV